MKITGKNLLIASFILFILGVAMFILGLHVFTYQGSELNQVTSFLGMISFFAWLPTIIAGIIIFTIGMKTP